MSLAARRYVLSLGLMLAACGGEQFSSGNPGGAGPTSDAGAGGESQGGKPSATGGVTNSAGMTTNAGATSGGSANGGAGGITPSGGAPNDGGNGGGDPMPSECPCAAPTPTCENGKCVVRGPTMVKAGSFYIDSTEVTVQQYDGFLRAKVDASKQAPECSWNDDFEPEELGIVPTKPVVRVDFCDAAAYCAWADKQLCGKIGGGKLQFDELSLASKSQWFAGCAGPDAQLYPYGAAHLDGHCNDSSSGKNSLADVKSYDACNGGYSGLFDMIGNVAEWVDACDATSGASDGCETSGGSYLDASACTGSSLKHRKERSSTVGIRCCSQQ